MRKMKIIYDFLSKIYIKDSGLLLGRWSINYCQNSINKKIDSGNIDHCGPCGQYDLKNNNKNKINNNKIITVNKLLNTYKK
jgi:hypothetical protein